MRLVLRSVGSPTLQLPADRALKWTCAPTLRMSGVPTPNALRGRLRLQTNGSAARTRHRHRRSKVEVYASARTGTRPPAGRSFWCVWTDRGARLHWHSSFRSPARRHAHTAGISMRTAQRQHCMVCTRLQSRPNHARAVANPSRPSGYPVPLPHGATRAAGSDSRRPIVPRIGLPRRSSNAARKTPGEVPGVCWVKGVSPTSR